MQSKFLVYYYTGNENKVKLASAESWGDLKRLPLDGEEPDIRLVVEVSPDVVSATISESALGEFTLLVMLSNVTMSEVEREHAHRSDLVVLDLEVVE